MYNTLNYYDLRRWIKCQTVNDYLCLIHYLTDYADVCYAQYISDYDYLRCIQCLAVNAYLCWIHYLTYYAYVCYVQNLTDYA